MVKIGKFEQILDFLSKPCIEYIEEDHRELDYYKQKVKELESRIKFLEGTKVIEIKRNEKKVLEGD